jgi:hypothetical protein
MLGRNRRKRWTRFATPQNSAEHDVAHDASSLAATIGPEAT